MSEALLLSAVSRTFGTTVAVDAVDLSVSDGELLALVGPSGCGKSTLLRIVAGLVAADSGSVTIGGELVEGDGRRADPEHRDVGLVFQEHALFPHMTVGDNLMFGLRGRSKPDRVADRDRWLDMVGLAGGADRYPHELSGGERQRVALARALAPGPRLMLLDEPFASLDPNRRAQLRTDVVTMLRQAGTAAVFVTHDQAEAMAIGDRVAVMRAGRIEQLGTPENVFECPRNRFVAGFMGEANFLALGDDGRTTELGAVDTAAAAGPGSVVVVRPAQLGVTAIDAPEAGRGVTGEVVAREYQGSTRSYSVRLASGTIVRSTQASAVDLPIGSAVAVSIGTGPFAVLADDR